MARVGMLLRTRSARGRAGVNDCNEQHQAFSPTSTSIETRPRDDLYIAQQQPRTETNHSPFRPRTASSPEKQSNNIGQAVPTQYDQRLPQSIPLLDLPQPEMPFSTASREDMYIGVALGSPSQNPLPPLPYEAENVESPISSPPVSVDQYTQENGDSLKQKGRWKMFGGLFGKKGASTSELPNPSFYHVQHQQLSGAPSEELATSRHYNKAYRERKSSKDGNNHTNLMQPKRNSPVKPRTQGKLNIKPNVKRSQTAPLLREERRSPTPPPKNEGGYGSSARPNNGGGPMLLQVEIPDFAMERYSIMFGTVLQPKQPPLLVRRQAQLEKLKTKVGHEGALELPRYNDELLKPVRRATSPSSLSKSPSFSLFPSTSPISGRSESPSASRKPSPLQRSTTVPCAISPIRQAFERSQSITKEQSAVIVMVHSPAQSSDTPASSYNAQWSYDPSRTSTEASLAEDFGLDQVGRDAPATEPKDTDSSHSHSHAIRDEFRSATLSVKQHQQIQPIRLKGEHDHAEFKMGKPLSSTNFRPPVSSFSTRNPNFSTIQNTNRTMVANPLTSSPISAAEISIARQISLSRRQKQLVVPIVSKTARQPMQPTLVNVGRQEEGGERKGERRGHVSVKSSHVLIENA